MSSINYLIFNLIIRAIVRTFTLNLAILLYPLKLAKSISFAGLNCFGLSILSVYVLLGSGCDSMITDTGSDKVSANTTDTDDNNDKSDPQNNHSAASTVTSSTVAFVPPPKSSQSGEQLPQTDSNLALALAINTDKLDPVVLTLLPSLQTLLPKSASTVTLTNGSTIKPMATSDDIEQVKSQVYTAYSNGCITSSDTETVTHDVPDAIANAINDVSLAIDDAEVITQNAVEKSTGTHYSSTQDLIYERISQANNGIQDCNYANIQALTFKPKIPWLEEIVWLNIASIFSPQLILNTEGNPYTKTTNQVDGADGDSVNQDIVIRMLDDIKQGDKTVQHVPLAQLMATDIHFNKSGLTSHDTAYLTIHSVQKQNELLPLHYYQRIIMIDMSDNKQLALRNVLNQTDASASLLQVLQESTKRWSIAPDSRIDIDIDSDINSNTDTNIDTGTHIKSDYLDGGNFDSELISTDWPLHLSKQWYLNNEGLHLIYQPGEMISNTLPIHIEHTMYLIDVLVPPAIINEMLKTEYKIDATNTLNNAITQQPNEVFTDRVPNNAPQDNNTQNSDLSVKVIYLPIDMDQMVYSIVYLDTVEH